MPELPEVQVRVNYLKRTSLHKKISSVRVLDPFMVKNTSSRKLVENLTGDRFEKVKRRAKYIIVQTKKGLFLIMHLAMTGDLRFYKNSGKIPPYSKIIFNFSGGYNLAYTSSRRLGKIYLIKNQQKLEQLRRLGPEPLERSFVLESFLALLEKRKRGMIKPVLMDQKFIAGIGNIYSDEIMFHSRIRPYRRIATLSGEEKKKIFRNIKKILKEAVRANADIYKVKHRYIIPNREKKGRCPRCKNPLSWQTIGGRTAYFCKKCQR